jgi:hypothetical protein
VNDDGTGPAIPFARELVDWHRSEDELDAVLISARDAWVATHGALGIDASWLQGWLDACQWWADGSTR